MARGPLALRGEGCTPWTAVDQVWEVLGPRKISSSLGEEGRKISWAEEGIRLRNEGRVQI